MANSILLRNLTGPLLASFLFLLTACSPPQPVITDFNGSVMGTTWHVRLRSDPQQEVPDQQKLQTGIQAALDRVDWLMSTYKEESELSQLNRAPINQWIPISKELEFVLRLSQTISIQTEGAFDVTVGPLVNLWGFGPVEVTVPETEKIEALLSEVGTDKYVLEEGRVLKTTSLYIDLSGIAKGYGVDMAAEYLLSQGLDNFLVEVGGELRLSTPTESEEVWRVAVERPSALDRQVERVVPIRNAGMATSGNYRNFIVMDDVTYSHTINPKTGWPIPNDISSLTVIAKTSAEADGLATGLMVMGPEKALAFAEANDLAILMLLPDNEGVREVYSSAFIPYLE